MKITDDIIYMGVDDNEVDLFEGQYIVPAGMCYNSYVIKDERRRLWTRWTKNSAMSGLKS